MISFVCHFYGWSFKDVMQIPARTFFRFHREAQKMEARQFKELADIQLIQKCTFQWYDILTERYARIVDPTFSKIPELPDSTGALKPEEAKGALISIFSQMKRGLGYSGR